MNFMVMAQYRTRFQRLATELENEVVCEQIVKNENSPQPLKTVGRNKQHWRN
jgi:hypothetical protein